MFGYRPKFDLANWMTKLHPKVRLIDSYIPASHDASAYPMVSSIVISGIGGAIAQAGDYTEQLNAGSRYFDMRCQWHKVAYIGPKEVYLHHSKANFDTLESVLKNQIVPFARAHNELVFLDIDFDEDDNLSQAILDLLEKYIPASQIATAHLNPDGTFNPLVTWGDLKDKKFVIMWDYANNYGRSWLGYSDAMRWKPYENFDDHTIDEILAFLDVDEGKWDKRKMFVAQDIDTPKFSPVQQPAFLDRARHGKLNDWIEKHTPGANINVVFRDFMSMDYNRAAITHLVNLNAFSPEEQGVGSGMYINNAQLRTHIGIVGYRVVIGHNDYDVHWVHGTGKIVGSTITLDPPLSGMGTVSGSGANLMITWSPITNWGTWRTTTRDNSEGRDNTMAPAGPVAGRYANLDHPNKQVGLLVETDNNILVLYIAEQPNFCGAGWVIQTNLLGLTGNNGYVLQAQFDPGQKTLTWVRTHPDYPTINGVWKLMP